MLFRLFSLSTLREILPEYLHMNTPSVFQGWIFHGISFRKFWELLREINPLREAWHMFAVGHFFAFLRWTYFAVHAWLNVLSKTCTRRQHADVFGYCFTSLTDLAITNWSFPDKQAKVYKHITKTIKRNILDSVDFWNITGVYLCAQVSKERSFFSCSGQLN